MMDAPDPDRYAIVRRAVLPLLVIAAFVVAWASGLLDLFSLSNAIMHRRQLLALITGNFALALASYMLFYAALVTISFPGASLLTVAAGFLFGGPAGAAATVIAATGGAAGIFLIARTSLGEPFARRAGPIVTTMVEGFNRNAFSYLLSLRLAPIFPFWVINIAPALFNMAFLPYVVATFIGIIPGTFAYAYIGAGLGSVISAQEQANPGCADAGACRIDPSELVTPQILLALSALALAALLPVLLRQMRRRDTDG
jgi:uncharacterized membrane protein YdjX (TVP38/TMEM64 family)